MYEKMYNGIEPSYLNISISPMPHLCSPEQSFYSSELHQSPSKDTGGSDSYGSPVSSLGSPDIKSMSNLEDSFKCGNSSDRKSIKILQRPSTARSTEGRLHLDSEPSFAGQLARRGHRKKTLSLNPEEREALESLIEDVIIVGLDDTVIDSDESFDENADDDKVDDDGRSSDRNPTKSFSDCKGFPDKFLFSRDGQQRGKVKNNVNLNRSYGNNNNNNNNNGFSKDTAPRRHGKESFKSCSNKNSKDFSRNKELNFGNKLQKETPKKPFLDGQLEENGDKDRQSVSGMLGVNIYPAQLKVAIKHMDSLPPRFLRRLQNGQNRIGGSEPALQSLSELNLNSNRDSYPRSGNLNSSDPSSGSTEKDRSRSKHNQLEETKKTIRNLLSDLDQYTDEGITTPINSDGNSLNCLSPFMPSHVPPHLAQLERHKMNYDLKAPITSSVFRMPQTRYNSESRLDRPHPDMYAGYFPPSGGFRPEVPQSRDFVSLDVAQVSSAGYPCFKPVSDFSGYSGPYELNFLSHQPQQLLKKTSLKVDAPVFVSNQFQRKQHEMMPQKSPTLIGGPQMTSTPNKSMESGGIAFLPGVLNAEVAQQANMAKQQQQQQQQQQQLSNMNIKPPTTSFGSAAGVHHAFKMMHGPVFNHVQPVSHQGGPPLQNGMIQQSGSMMRMMNYGPPQPPTQSHQAPQMQHYPPYPAPNHPSMYMRPSDFSASVYQPWNCSPTNGDVPSGDSAWFPPMMTPYLSHPSVEGTQPSFVVSGDHQGLVSLEMMGQEWKVSVPFSPMETHESFSIEAGRQRALQLLSEGGLVLIILTGASDGDKLSKLQININGMVVVSMNGNHLGNLSPLKIKEQQEWNYRQVVEAMENHKGLIIVDHSFAQPSDLQELVYMAQMNGYEVVMISNYPKYSELPPNLDSSSLFVGGNCDFKPAMPVVGFPNPSTLAKPEGGVSGLDFPANNA